MIRTQLYILTRDLPTAVFAEVHMISFLVPLLQCDVRPYVSSDSHRDAR